MTEATYIKDWQEMVGETVEDVQMTDGVSYVFITLSNNKRAIVEIDRGYGDDSPELSLGTTEDFGVWELNKIGWVSPEVYAEYEQKERKRKDRVKKLQEDSDRAQYEELKKRFG